MPLYSFVCKSCGRVKDEIFTMAGRPDAIPCECGQEARHVITVSSVDLESECPAWLKSTAEVANPDGGAHCKEFIRNPTRANYRAWMAGEGLRPSEAGERPAKPSFDRERHKRLMLEAHRKRTRIFI